MHDYAHGRIKSFECGIVINCFETFIARGI